MFVGLRPKRTETWISNKTFKKEKTVYVARNGDAGEKRKPYQSNSVKWIYRFLRQEAGSYYFVAFLNYPRLSIKSESIFFAQKMYGFL